MKLAEYREAIRMATSAAEIRELLALASDDPELSSRAEASVQASATIRFEAIKGAATRRPVAKKAAPIIRRNPAPFRTGNVFRDAMFKNWGITSNS